MAKRANRRSLTARFIETVTKPGMYYDSGDTEQLALHVRKSGSKTWVIYRRWPPSNRPSRRPIGSAAELTLADARIKCRDWCTKAARGIDPRAEEARQKQITFGSVCSDYFAEVVRPSHRRAKRTEREIKRELIRLWGHRPIIEITPQDVMAMTRTIVRRGHATTAHHMLGHARQVFSFAFHEGARYGLTSNPVRDVQPQKLIGGSRAMRHRVLSNDEIRAVWDAATKLSYPVGDCIRWIMITGCRRSEASGLPWSEIDIAKKLWSIPSARFKSERIHSIPLTGPALALLAALPEEDRGVHVFSTTGGALGLNGWSKAWRELIEAGEIEMPELDPDDPENTGSFCIHDLRRTVRTRMSDIGIPDDAAEAALGHQTKSRLQRVYDKSDPLPAKRRALDAWARLLMEIVEDKPRGNVRRLRG